MLLDHLFTVTKTQRENDSITASLHINAGHDILKGHFPGQPVVPGVCMMQVMKELVELHTGRRLRLSEADNIKFLAVIDPRENQDVEASIGLKFVEETIVINGSLFSGPVTFFKLKASLNNA